MSIASKLQAVKDAKLDIKKSIENKAVDLSSVEFTDYADEITALEKKKTIDDDVLGGVFDYAKVEQVGSTLNIVGVAPIMQKENSLHLYLELEHEKTERTVGLQPDFVAGNLDEQGNVVVEPASENEVLRKVVIQKDPDLIPANIKKNKNVFGVGGDYEGEGSVEPEGSGVGTVFVGWTMPLTYKNASQGEKTFYVESQGGYELEITGLTGYATVSGQNSSRVEFEVTENGLVDLIVPYLITATKGDEEYNYIGRLFYYGTEVTSGNCLTVASLILPENNSAGNYVENWSIIESPTYPTFATNTTTWATLYSHQIVSFVWAKMTQPTVMGDYFLYSCFSFNQPLDLSSLQVVGNNFMYSCFSFNQPIDLSSLQEVGDNFLYYCLSFNQPLDLSSLQVVGNNFMYSISAFNQPIDLSSLQEVGDNFIYLWSNFNQPLDLSSLQVVGNNFINACYAFNQPLDLSSLQEVGNYFMSSCQAFNQPLDLSSLQVVGNSFMISCFSFNQPIDLSSIQEIGNKFMYNCYAFNQHIKITSTTTSVGTHFLYNCYALTLVEINTPATNFATSNDTLSQTLNTKRNGTGIKVIGTYASAFKSRFGNRSSSPYRTLV